MTLLEETLTDEQGDAVATRELAVTGAALNARTDDKDDERIDAGGGGGTRDEGDNDGDADDAGVGADDMVVKRTLDLCC